MGFGASDFCVSTDPTRPVEKKLPEAHMHTFFSLSFFKRKTRGVFTGQPKAKSSPNSYLYQFRASYPLSDWIRIIDKLLSSSLSRFSVGFQSGLWPGPLWDILNPVLKPLGWVLWVVMLKGEPLSWI